MTDRDCTWWWWTFFARKTSRDYEAKIRPLCYKNNTPNRVGHLRAPKRLEELQKQSNRVKCSLADENNQKAILKLVNPTTL